MKLAEERTDGSAAGRERAALPISGLSRTSVLTALDDAKGDDYAWSEGTLPLYVYWRSKDAYELSRDAYAAYFTENGMGQRAFPSVAKLERDVVDFTLELTRAPDGATGTFTTGGTESILMAVKTARDRARSTGRLALSARGKIIVPVTAHPAFSKAAHFLDLDEVRIPLDANLRVDTALLADAVDGDVVLIAGSAPNFAHGVYDDIVTLGKIASDADVWFHVDACVGGMLAPFIRSLGRDVPEYDFTVAGVDSMSVDLHKYGYAAKGASVMLLRDPDSLQFQRFEFDDWPRGHYTTPAMLGTRPAGPIASAWAVMNYLGHEGYREGARIIVEAKDKLVAGINEIDGVTVVEPHDLSFLMYTSDSADVDINAVADQMGLRGWFVGRSLEPSAVHLMVNPVHGPVVGKYVTDLNEVVADVRQRGLTGTVDAHTY